MHSQLYPNNVNSKWIGYTKSGEKIIVQFLCQIVIKMTPLSKYKPCQSNQMHPPAPPTMSILLCPVFSKKVNALRRAHYQKNKAWINSKRIEQYALKSNPDI
jgi:hypothetical protein